MRISDDLSKKTLVCQLYDFRQFEKTDKLADMKVRLNCIPCNEDYSIQENLTREIVEKDRKKEVGVILITRDCT